MASLQGWGRETWSSGAWDEQAPVSVTGNGLTSSTATPTVTGDCNITLTGIALTSSVGQATGTGLAIVNATGNALTSSLGTETVTGNATISPTGIGLTASLGDETATTVAQSGWNRGANQDTGTSIGWGDNLWGTLETEYALTGVQGTINTGTLGFQGDVAPTITGNELTGSVGTVLTSIEITGQQLSTAIGTYTVTGDNETTVVAGAEQELVASLGTPGFIFSYTLTGVEATSSTGSVTVSANADVTVTGVSMTSSLGEETVTGGATVSPTGASATSSVGSVTVTGTAVISPTGVQATGNIGEVIIESVYFPTGVQATGQTGVLNIRGDSNFTVTGVSATSTTGTLQGTFWSAVDDSNSDISWTEVHKAA